MQPSRAQNRKRKKAREEAESRQKEALNTWIKRSRVEVEKIGNNEAAKNSLDTCVATDDAPSCEVPSRRRTVKPLAWQKDYYML